MLSSLRFEPDVWLSVYAWWLRQNECKKRSSSEGRFIFNGIIDTAGEIIELKCHNWN